MSSLIGIEDANKFEHVLEPVIAKKVEHRAIPTTAAESSSTEVKHFFASSPTLEAGTVEDASHNAHSPEVVFKERMLALLSVVLAGLGIAIGWFGFIKRPLRKMPKILEEKWRLDEFYNGYIVDPITRLSTVTLWRGFDIGFVDGIVNGIGSFVAVVGSAVRSVQVGFVRSYAAFIIGGAVVVLGYFIYFGMKLIG
jgi:NADH-quinone oxidoreductase subunit L